MCQGRSSESKEPSSSPESPWIHQWDRVYTPVRDSDYCEHRLTEALRLGSVSVVQRVSEEAIDHREHGCLHAYKRKRPSLRTPAVSLVRSTRTVGCLYTASQTDERKTCKVSTPPLASPTVVRRYTLTNCVGRQE